MADLSFRDRFWSRPVGRALTSPTGILAAGAGAAVGIVLTAPVSVPLAVAGGVVGAALGLGARVGVAMGRAGGETMERIDPFAVGEPWRHAVRDALHARDRFEEAVHGFQPGPLRDSLTSDVEGRFDDAVRECWEIAKQGQLITKARQRLDIREAQWQLGQIRDQAGGRPLTPTQQNTVTALESQVQTAARMDQLMADTKSQLDLLNARLDESVTKTIELSVGNRVGDAATLGNDVEAIVDDLEALRRAMAEVDGTPEPPSGTVATG